jgi:hypothetical protein
MGSISEEVVVDGALPADWPSNCKLTNQVLTMEVPKPKFHKCKSHHYKQEGGLHVNHPPDTVHYLHKNFQGMYAGNDFTWKKHYDIPFEKLEEHRTSAYRLFKSRIVNHPFEGESFHEVDDHFFKTANHQHFTTFNN